MNKKINLNDMIDAIKSIRQVIKEKGCFGKNKGDRMFSMYCFILENSDRPGGWTPPMSLTHIADSTGRRERITQIVMKEIVDSGLVERERVGWHYRYRLIDLDIKYERG